MGQTLSEPVVEKKSRYESVTASFWGTCGSKHIADMLSNGANARFIYGVSAMQGWRVSMEDAHTAILELTDGKGEQQISIFAVYDGHGGDLVARYTGARLHHILKEQDSFNKGDYSAALKETFLATDVAIRADKRLEQDSSGCTATVNLITGDGRIVCANAGDSRTVLGSKGSAKPLSFDHKPQNEEEKARICAAGGFVDFGRVNGNLALSRAIGDFEFKKNEALSAEKQVVTADPDVTTHQITEDDEFLVVACDGIWDCKSSQAVVEFVRRGVVASQELDQICENLMDHCLAPSSDGGGIGCDNMTMMIVALLQKGQTKEEWYKMIQDRVANNEGPCAPAQDAELKGPQSSQFRSREIQFGSFGQDNDEDAENGTEQTDTTKPGEIIVLGDGSELLKEGQDDQKETIAEAESASVDDSETAESK